MIQSAHLLMSSRPPIVILAAIYGYREIGVRIITERVANLLRIFLPIVIYFLSFTARAGFIGNYIEHLVLIIENFHIFLSFVFRILILIHSISPTYHISSHFILDGPVGTHTSAILDTMRHVLLIRHSCLLAKHAIALYTVVLVCLFMGFVVL